MPATAKTAAPTHFATVGDASTSRPAPSSPTYATSPKATHTIRYPAKNCATPFTRCHAVSRTDTDRIQTTTMGATGGNIIAVIITTQSARNARSVTPIVPGPLPMPLAWSTVTIHAKAASRQSAIHHASSCFSGRPSDGVRAASVSALVLEVGHEAVRAGVLDVPVTVVADVPGLGLRDGLGDRAQQRVGDDG